MSVSELSPIEEQVVLLVAGGETTNTIAGQLRLSLKTVEWHLARARQKLERAATLLDRVEEAVSPALLDARKTSTPCIEPSTQKWSTP